MRVVNPGSMPLDLDYFHPLAFALEASASGKPVEVHVPAWHGPVEPRVLRVEPQGSNIITTAISLAFIASSDPRSTSPHRWQLIHAPTLVELRALRAFGNRAIVCIGTLTPP